VLPTEYLQWLQDNFPWYTLGDFPSIPLYQCDDCSVLATTLVYSEGAWVSRRLIRRAGLAAAPDYSSGVLDGVRFYSACRWYPATLWYWRVQQAGGELRLDDELNWCGARDHHSPCWPRLIIHSQQSVLLPYPTQDDDWLEPLREIVTDPVDSDEFRNFLARVEFPTSGFYSSDSE
jgi:hypothetical protein